MAIAIPKLYTVGANHTIDTSSYAGSTDPNAVALKAYDNQLKSFKTALQSAYDSQAAANISAQNKVKSQFDSARSNVYTNARLSAIGNNERLAALGLAGNIYDHARSGTSETNRIAQDIAMRRSLSSLDQGQADAYSEYQLALLQAQKEADMNYANKVAEVEAAKIPYQMALAQALATVSGGGGGGGGYSYTPSSKKKSGGGGGSNNKSGVNSGSAVQDILTKAATAAAKTSGTSSKQNAAANAAANAIRTYGSSLSNSDAAKAAALVSELNYKMSGMYK
ncbi:MAG: hypothetical protein ACI4NL_00580 [Christensenellales bacterium]